MPPFRPLTPPHITTHQQPVVGCFITSLAHFPPPSGLHAARSLVPRPRVPAWPLGAGLGAGAEQASDRVLEAGTRAWRAVGAPGCQDVGHPEALSNRSPLWLSFLSFLSTQASLKCPASPLGLLTGPVLLKKQTNKIPLNKSEALVGFVQWSMGQAASHVVSRKAARAGAAQSRRLL